MSVVVVATITPLDGQVDAVRSALLEAVPQVHDEPGCELYALHEDGQRFIMVERWESTEALDAHGRAPALQALGGALQGKVAGPVEVLRLTAVPGGDATKGAL